MAVNRRPAAVTRSERDGFGDRYEFGVDVGGTPWVTGPGMGRPLRWLYETVEIFCVRGLSAFRSGMARYRGPRSGRHIRARGSHPNREQGETIRHGEP